MSAKKGNQNWKLRSKHGRDKLFATPKLLWEAACEYFQWVEDNPLREEKAFSFQGKIIKTELPKMRAMTIRGLCFYLHCNEDYFRHVKANLPSDEEDFRAVIDDIENVIYNQKFQGAAAELLNPNIIARDLGLSDKSELTGAGGRDLVQTQIIVQDERTANAIRQLEENQHQWFKQ